MNLTDTWIVFCLIVGVIIMIPYAILGVIYGMATLLLIGSLLSPIALWYGIEAFFKRWIYGR